MLFGSKFCTSRCFFFFFLNQLLLLFALARGDRLLLSGLNPLCFVCFVITFLTDISHKRLPWWLSGKESVCQFRRHGFDPCVGKIPWRRAWQPTPVFLPGEFHGQGSWRTTVHGVTKSQTRLSN